MESSLHWLVNLIRGDYYAYVEKIKYNMRRIDIFITFVTLHSIYPIYSFACHFTHNTGKMCKNHAQLKKWKIFVDQPKKCPHEETYWIWKEKKKKKKNGHCVIRAQARPRDSRRCYSLRHKSDVNLCCKITVFINIYDAVLKILWAIRTRSHM